MDLCLVLFVWLQGKMEIVLSYSNAMLSWEDLWLKILAGWKEEDDLCIFDLGCWFSWAYVDQKDYIVGSD